jgi:Protein of unknown function (DUF3800)
MYLMYADEADQDGSKEFLVYAGVFIPMKQVAKIHASIQHARNKHGFSDGDVLKFSASTAPKSVSKEAHAAIKSDILALAGSTECKTCCYVVPHAISKNQKLETKLKFAVNTLLVKFDQFLRENKEAGGVVCFDHSTDYKQVDYFKEIMEYGIAWGEKRVKLERVAAIHQSRIGLSHLASLADIVVGSFRFAINEPDKDKVGASLIKQLETSMWGVMDKDGELNVAERGICVRPRDVKLDAHAADLLAFLKRLEDYSKK